MVTTIESKPRSGARVLAVLGALVVAALIIGLAVSGTRSSRSFEPGTPEAVVQEYVGHVFAARMAEALALLKDPEQCAPAFGGPFIPVDQRADLVSSTKSASGNLAYVVLRFEHDDDSLFQRDPTPWQVRFTLERTDEGWRLIQPSWPVPQCGPQGLTVPSLP